MLTVVENVLGRKELHECLSYAGCLTQLLRPLLSHFLLLLYLTSFVVVPNGIFLVSY